MSAQASVIRQVRSIGVSNAGAQLLTTPAPPSSSVLSVNLSSSLVGIAPMNAGDFVGTVTVTTTGGPYAGQVVLGGADASKFVLTNSGFLPTNLVVGASNIPAGSYNITLTAN